VIKKMTETHLNKHAPVGKTRRSLKALVEGDFDMNKHRVVISRICDAQGDLNLLNIAQ
jgi:hypothetical protein